MPGGKLHSHRDGRGWKSRNLQAKPGGQAHNRVIVNYQEMVSYMQWNSSEYVQHTCNHIEEGLPL